MRIKGFLGQKERQIAWLESADLSSAQQMDPIHYESGQVIEFCRRAKGGFKSGERWGVSRKEGDRVFVTRDGVEKVLPLQQWKTFNVYRFDTMPVAVGEHLLITKNNRGANLRNGELCKVAAIDGDRITLDNGRQLNSSRPLHIRQGYTVTSQASQSHESVKMFGFLTLRRFIREVVAHYRAAAHDTPAEFVYGGSEYASEDTIATAERLGLRLFSFIEYQGLIDFREYVKKQTERLSRDDVYPPNLYVQQRMEFQAGFEPLSTDDALGQVCNWVSESEPRFVLILGNVGTGKTFLLREIARTLGQQFGTPTSFAPPAPLLIELRTLEKAHKLDQLLASHFARHDFRRFDLSALRYMIRQGRVVLLFDGFDELALRVGYDKAAAHLDTLIEAANGDARLVVTSRTTHFESDKQVRGALGRHVEDVRGLRYCRLKPFDQTQIRTFLVHRFESEREANLWLQLLKDIRDLLGLSGNPRMLSFICQLTRNQLEDARTHSGHVSAAQLYDILLLKHWLGHEMARSHPDGAAELLTPQQWLDSVTALALELWSRVDRWLTTKELDRVVLAALQRYAPDKLSQTEEATHALGSGTLFIWDEESRFTFIHQSVLEWLVARRIAKELQAEEPLSLLDSGTLSDLMADFLLDLNELVATKWCSSVLRVGPTASDSARKNALTVYQRQLKRLEDAVARADHVEHLQAEQRLYDWHYVSGIQGGIDLSGQSLQGRDLTGVDLRRANLRGTDLRAVLLRALDLACCRPARRRGQHGRSPAGSPG